MTVVNGYCEVDELREQFDDAAAALPTALLERAINATSRAIDRFTGRRFWQDPTATVRTFRPTYCWRANVDDISTTAGLVVKVDATIDGTYSTTWTLGTDYALRPANAIADGEPYWQIWPASGVSFPTSSAAFDALQVTAKFGWPAIPPEVNLACILRSASLFKRRESIDGVRGFGDFGVVRISRQMDPDVADLLSPFMHVEALMA